MHFKRNLSVYISGHSVYRFYLLVCSVGIFYAQGQAVNQNDLLVRQRALIVQQAAVQQQRDSVEVVYASMASRWEQASYATLSAFYTDLSTVRTRYKTLQTTVVAQQGNALQQSSQTLTSNELVPTDAALSAEARGLAALYADRADFQAQANTLWEAVWRIKKQENEIKKEQALLALDQRRYQELNDRYRSN